MKSVQRRAAKLVDGLKGFSYPEILQKIDLPTLIYRRKRGDMIEIYKHFHVYDKHSLPPTFRLQIGTSRNSDLK